MALQRTHDPLSKPYAWLPDPALHPVQTEALAHVVQPVGQVAHAAVPPAEYSLAAHAAHVVLPSWPYPSAPAPAVQVWQLASVGPVHVSHPEAHASASSAAVGTVREQAKHRHEVGVEARTCAHAS